MNKIKKTFEGMVNSVKGTFNRFPLTTILVFVVTIIISFLVINANFTDDIDEMIMHIVCISVCATSGVWFAEALFDDRTNIKQICGYVISFVIAVFIDRSIKFEWLEEALLARWIMEYTIICFLGLVYILIRKANIDFEKYILNLILNIKRASIIYGIVSIGVLILFAIFKVLILDSLKFYVVGRIICLFTGFYYIPVLMSSFSNEDAEDTKFNKAVFAKVLLPLVSLAMVIVYMYIVKIFLITEVPKNELFSILSLIFVCAFPVYVVNKNYAEKGTLTFKINKAIPFLYIPFIFLQMYSIGIRISTYGLTTSRYMGVVLIIFEIGAIALAVVRDSKNLREIVLYTSVISVVVTVTPLNYDTFPKLSQKRRVDKYVELGVPFNDLEDDQKRKFAGAYQYIKYDEEYINSALTQVDKEQLSSYSTYRYTSNSSSFDNDAELAKEIDEYLRYEKTLDAVSIAEYSQIYEVPYFYGDDGTIIHYSRFPKVSVGGEISYVQTSNSDKYEYELNFDVDLKDYIYEIIDAYNISSETAKRVFKEIEVTKIDETRDLYLTRLSFDYYRESNRVDNLCIEGYVLEK